MTSTKKQGDVYVTLPDGLGGGEGQSILVGYVESGGLFPTTRPDGTALVLGDYVKPKGTVPFTIGTITFSSLNDTAAWTGVEWMLNATQFQKTSETPVNNRPNESLSGTAEYQDDINKEFKTAINANTEARHTHANKSVLDTYTQTEANIADAVSKKHSHSNKVLLDTYTQTEANIADAVSKKHEHSNKSELDLIVTGDKAKWDGMLPKAVPTAAQGTKEYLYTFAGSAQNTDVALINDMSSGSESYTDKMVPTAKSVATALEDKQSLVSGTHTDEIASLDSDGKVVASGHEIAELDQLRADVDSIDVDNMGDAHAKSVDMDEIPKVCGFPMILFGTAAPDVTPDFIGQTFIDTANGKIYMASDVANASSFKVLN